MTTELNVQDMIENPATYGFEWGFGPLHKKGMQVCALAPHIVHKDVDLLRATFGDSYFFDSMNSQSARVRDQTLRDAIWDEKSLASKPTEMKRWVLDKALGRHSRTRRQTIVEVQVQVFIANDGQEFSDKAECMAHNVDLQLAGQ